MRIVVCPDRTDSTEILKIQKRSYTKMFVTSPSFKNNGMIPKQYTGFGEDISPELSITAIPEKAASLAIILDDLDVPFCQSFTHWIIWNIPPAETIPAGIPKGATIDSPFHAVQGKAWGKHVYRGPKQPPFIRKAHRYRFTVYALDTELILNPDSRKSELLKAMSGHLIEAAELTGIFDPKKPRYCRLPVRE